MYKKLFLIIFSLLFLESCGHDIVYIEGVLPTCTESGYKGYYACETCDYTKGYLELAPLGHNMIMVEGKEATDKEIGYTSYMMCDRCGYIEGRTFIPCKVSLEERPYIKDLSENNLKAFYELYNGAMNFKETIDLESSVSVDDFNSLMVLLNYYCPELIQVKGDYRYNSSNGKVTKVKLNYIMDEEEYLKSWAEVEDIIKQIVNEVALESEFEKEFYAYNWILDNCSYDRYSEDAGSTYGALVLKNARCEGYSKSLMLILWGLGIECYTVLGEALEKHSWNIVNIDGKYYFLDPTWDDLEKKTYGFFNVSLDTMINANHYVFEFFSSIASKCQNVDLSIAYINNTYIEKDKDVLVMLNDIYDRCFKRNDKVIYIKVETFEQFEILNENASEFLSDYLCKNNISASFNIVHDENGKTLMIEIDN